MTAAERESLRVIRGVGIGRAGAVGPVAKVRRLPAIDPGTPVFVDGLAVRGLALQRRVMLAFERVTERLSTLSRGAGGAKRELLAATSALADDRALRSEVLGRIRDGQPPVAAVDAVIEGFSLLLQDAPEFPAQRIADLGTVRDLVVADLLELPAPGAPVIQAPSVLVAVDLAFADTVTVDPAMVLAIVTEFGGPTSHSAVLASQLGIPCVVQASGAMSLHDGAQIAVDARVGTVTVLSPRKPGPEAPAVDATEFTAEFVRRAETEQALGVDRAPGATADGLPVPLFANIGTVAEAQRLTDSAVEGVGLFRTEMLYLDSTRVPTFEDQAEAYCQVFDALGERTVVVRTLDAGADKPLPYVNHPIEENPALGLRGYRLGRIMADLQATQLAAVAEAARRTGARPDVMAPMISTPAEAREFAQAARSAGLERVGVMIEVPAAALRAEAILAEVDFVSLGTNDLAQYTMAADRWQGALGDLLDPWQPAVLDLVAIAARAGIRVRKPVGVCGIAAGDPAMALVLVGLGVTSLSMPPGAVPAVRFALRHHTLAQAAHMAEAALDEPSPQAAYAAALALFDPGVRDELGL